MQGPTAAQARQARQVRQARQAVQAVQATDWMMARPLTVKSVGAMTSWLRSDYESDPERAHGYHDALLDRYVAWCCCIAPSKLPIARAIAKLLRDLSGDAVGSKWYA